MTQVINTIEKKKNFRGDFRLPIDDLRGALVAYHNWGAGNPAFTLVTLATAAPGAARGRVVSIIAYAGNAGTTAVISDNGVQNAPTLYHAAQGYGPTPINKPQIGGMTFTTDFTVDPSANLYELVVVWIPEYDTNVE